MIYVDKTHLISKIESQISPLFFSRPRRFGKSLLVNTLACLFSRGLSYFHGLEIEKSWNDTIYQVVRLDFSSLAGRSVSSFKNGLMRRILKNFKIHELDILKKYDNPSDLLVDILDDQDNNSLVLLIDEYDAPLTHNINRPRKLNEIMDLLNDFYATIKQYTDKFPLIFITGITRANHVSIFSSFNNLKDISLENGYNDLLGFKYNDLENYFDLHVA